MGILNNFKIGSKIIGGYVVVGLAMAILAYMLLSSISGHNNKFDFLVHHDAPVLINAQHLTGNMANMETGLHAYLVTGDVGFLDPYFSEIDVFNITMAEEQDLTNDNPVAVATLNEIHEMERDGCLATPNLLSNSGKRSKQVQLHRPTSRRVLPRPSVKRNSTESGPCSAKSRQKKSPRPMAEGLFVRLATGLVLPVHHLHRPGLRIVLEAGYPVQLLRL